MAADSGKVPSWVGYVTLIAACIAAMRVGNVWITYRYFWVNAWDEVAGFAVFLVVHLIARPKENEHFRKHERRAAIATVVIAAAILVFLAGMRIG
jgi:hypothetical protein